MNLYGFKEKSFSSSAKRRWVILLIILIVTVYSALFSKNIFGLLEPDFCEELRIDIVNVGQGDCSLIRTPNGRTILMDGGTNVSRDEAAKTGRVLIQDYLVSQNIDKIDCMIVTHWHVDDYSGLIPVLRNYPVGVVYETPIGFTNDIYEEFNQICIKKNIRRVSVMAGNRLEVGDELFVQVLNPEDCYASERHSEINDDSIVLLIRYGKVQVLMCADIGEEAEREILKYNEGLKSQIIKIPDHGADRSAYKPFFRTVGAKDGIISVGANNPFGYPSEEHLDFLKELGVRLYRTDLNGTVRIKIGGKDENDYTISVDRNL